jgi:hypothetical protein
MAVCVGFGLDVWTAGGASGNFVAGWVVTFQMSVVVWARPSLTAVWSAA